MTRLTNILSAKKTRNWCKPPNATYRVLLAPLLKNSVKGSHYRKNEVGCLDQLSALLNCWKSNDFSSDICSKEIANFAKCVDEAAEQKKARKIAEKSGETLEEGRYLPVKVNKMLNNFKQPPHNIKLRE